MVWPAITKVAWEIEATAGVGATVVNVAAHQLAADGLNLESQVYSLIPSMQRPLEPQEWPSQSSMLQQVLIEEKIPLSRHSTWAGVTR